MKTIDGMAPRASFISQLAYRRLVWSAPIARNKLGARVWERAWNELTRRSSGTVELDLHGRRVVANMGHPYPAWMRRWPTYNQPLVTLVLEIAALRNRSVGVVDVGASIGDTALLVREQCGSVIDEVWCIEGDSAFAALLRHNVQGLDEMHVVEGLASDGDAEISALVRIHAGTASPQGETMAPASTLDALTSGARHIDVLKIDTDGFDGRVLAGAVGILAAHRPAVLFEWHPELARAAGVPAEAAFRVLGDAGYTHFLWFDKYGSLETRWSHVDYDALQARAKECLSPEGLANDTHFDVIALSADDAAAFGDAQLEPGSSHR